MNTDVKGTTFRKCKIFYLLKKKWVVQQKNRVQHVCKKKFELSKNGVIKIKKKYFSKNFN